MFGADTPLVLEALQMVGAAVIVTGGVVWFLLRRGEIKDTPETTSKAGTLEDRVRNLERIATDRSVDLADEIESLRQGATTKELN